MVVEDPGDTTRPRHQHDDPVAEEHGLIDVMGHQHHGDPLKGPHLLELDLHLGTR